MTTKIDDHVGDAVARLTAQYKGKANIEALVAALVRPSQAIEDAFWQLFVERTVDVATGITLTQLGKVVGQPRLGVTDDDDFRRYVRARIAANRSRATWEDLINVARLVLDDEAVALELEFQAHRTIVVRTSGGSAVVGAVPQILYDFLYDARGSGVRLILEIATAAVSDTFTFPYFTQLNGAETSGGPKTINVDDASKFAEAGTFTIDAGLAVEESPTYTGKTATTLTGVTFANAHADNAPITSDDTPGKGMGDIGDGSVGGRFAHAIDAPEALPELYQPATFPENVAQHLVSYPLGPPDYIWGMQDTAAASELVQIAEAVTGLDSYGFLLNDQPPTNQQSGEGGRFSILFDNSNEAMSAGPSAAFLVPVGSARTFWLRAFPTSPTATNTNLFDANGEKVYIRIQSTGFVGFNVEDLGANQGQATISADHRAAWDSYVLVIDNDTGAEADVVLYTSKGSASDTLSGGTPGQWNIECEFPTLGTDPGNGYYAGFLATYPYALTAAEAALLTGISP